MASSVLVFSNISGYEWLQSDHSDAIEETATFFVYNNIRFAKITYKIM